MLLLALSAGNKVNDKLMINDTILETMKTFKNIPYWFRLLLCNEEKKRHKVKCMNNRYTTHYWYLNEELWILEILQEIQVTKLIQRGSQYIESASVVVVFLPSCVKFKMSEYLHFRIKFWRFESFWHLNIYIASSCFHFNILNGYIVDVKDELLECR
jgi:hypothetical protein